MTGITRERVSNLLVQNHAGMLLFTWLQFVGGIFFRYLVLDSAPIDLKAQSRNQAALVQPVETYVILFRVCCLGPSGPSWLRLCRTIEPDTHSEQPAPSRSIGISLCALTLELVTGTAQARTGPGSCEMIALLSMPGPRSQCLTITVGCGKLRASTDVGLAVQHVEPDDSLMPGQATANARTHVQALHHDLAAKSVPQFRTLQSLQGLTCKNRGEGWYLQAPPPGRATLPRLCFHLCRGCWHRSGGTQHLGFLCIRQRHNLLLSQTAPCWLARSC